MKSVIFFFILTSSIYANSIQESTYISTSIEKQISGNITNSLISIYEISNKEWDTLHTLGPYSSIEKIKEFTQAKNIWRYKSGFNQIQYSDSYTLLIMVKDEKIVEYVYISRGLVDLAKDEKITRNNSSFYVEYKNGWTYGIWINP